MRTLVDLGEAQVHALDELSKADKKPRAVLIRQAIDDFLAKRRSAKDDDAFGLWGQRRTDGLTYQKKIRDEW